ncbi:unnamed protein product [Rotaria magnacalcarata]|uniref:Adenosine kinase n=1 Tax=Rotaria magnacalcarata TaxID=392030 RepID=A0A819UY57_9BILA|nr:unnamed protein product [Rotaria magnacalcarata]
MTNESSDYKNINDGTIFGIGNPLLDIIAEVPISFLETYNLKANDAILATDAHRELNESVLHDYPNHRFVAGGATQNSMRAATWLLQQPNICVYMGCVGEDKYHPLLHDAAAKSGLLLSYQVYANPKEQIQTGTCAVLITGNNRVFFYTVCPSAVMRICDHADKHDKIFCTNLSAPFICEFFGDKLMLAMPYVDYLFGNETEATSFAKFQLQLDTKDMKVIAKAISELPKKNSQRKRVVIVTQGSESTLLAVAGEDIKEFPVKKPLEIVDTNGAGDSFVGGFLAYLSLGKTHEEAIQAGAYCAFECIQQSGCTFPDKPSFDPTTFLSKQKIASN